MKLMFAVVLVMLLSGCKALELEERIESECVETALMYRMRSGAYRPVLDCMGIDLNKPKEETE